MLEYHGSYRVYIVLDTDGEICDVFSNDVSAIAYIGQRLLNDGIELEYVVYYVKSIIEEKIYNVGTDDKVENIILD